MKLKAKINKDDYEKLSEELKKLYWANGDEYQLQVEGMKTEDDIAALKRAKDREAQEKRDAVKELNELKAAQDKDKDDNARKAGDIDTLTRSYEEKLANQKTEYDTKLGTKDQFIRDTLVDSKANELASKLFTVPSAMLSYVKSRLSVDFEGETPTLRIMDAAGKVSAASVDDLQKEILANKEFSSILVGSKASGSGAGTGSDGQKGQSSANFLNAEGQPKSMREMNAKEKVAYLKSKREENENGTE
jgi:hypothetical protein